MGAGSRNPWFQPFRALRQKGEEDLADHCASSGEVASVELLTRGRAQRPSGSAVVEYRYAEAAAAAVDALEGTELDGRDLRVRAYFSN